MSWPVSTASTADQVLELVRKAGVLRPRDLDEHGIPRAYLQRLMERGELVRVARGLYTLPDADVTEKHSYVEACKRVPHGVICLLSALRFQGLTTLNPFEVWMAIEQSAWRPREGYPPLRIVYLSGPAFEEGIERHNVEGVTVRVYNMAKTVTDCFKFRNKIGEDVAVEALRGYLSQRPPTLDDLWRFAEINRVTRVIRPYVEALA